jgi:hypothetical protein
MDAYRNRIGVTVPMLGPGRDRVGQSVTLVESASAQPLVGEFGEPPPALFISWTANGYQRTSLPRPLECRFRADP